MSIVAGRPCPECGRTAKGMKDSRIVLVDWDPYTASLLAGELAARGCPSVQIVSDSLELPAALDAANPHIVIFNYRADQPDSVVACSMIRMLAPQAAIAAIASAGPALKAVQAWARQTGCIDVFFEKPLSYDRFFATLGGLADSRVSARALASKAKLLSTLVPEGALSAAAGRFRSEAEMFEAAVLFTDIRGSSEVIRSTAPREFFRLLNDLLSAQSRLVTKFEGSVIKYTGDGVMAIFRGMGRSYLALRCGLELARTGMAAPLPYGTGVAEGLVLAGLIGDSNEAGQRRQYDVIGATVHLSARLCSLASPGELYTTHGMNAVARIESPAPRHVGRVSIKGFEGDIECVAFGPSFA